jgi:Phosphodiester glycosidase
MTRRHIPVARLTAVAAVVVGVLVVLRGTSGPHWRTLRPGIAFTTLRGEPWCRRGSAEIAVLRLDPGRARVRVHYFSRDSSGRPLNIVEWQRRTGALAVFNAGQYYADYSYMGLLVSGGDTLSSRAHDRFKAMLVASSGPGAPRARVLDLDRDSLRADSSEWSDVAQSFMLFDRTGAVRVRRSDLVANRTAVAEDRSGRMLVLTSEGGYTLADFAAALQASPLELSHAMAMDGGYEAELCVQSGHFRYATFGRWDRDREDADAPGARVPLPAVISVTEP